MSLKSKKVTIKIPEGCNIRSKSSEPFVYLYCVGPKGQIELIIPEGLTVEVHSKGGKQEELNICLDANSTLSSNKCIMGTFAKLITNGLKGVLQNHRVQLNMIGVGYRVTVQPNLLVLRLGYSHEIHIPFDQKTIDIVAPKPNILILGGVSLDAIKRKAAEIRSWLPPEPYKGKGIFYKNEVTRRKVGKKN